MGEPYSKTHRRLLWSDPDFLALNAADQRCYWLLYSHPTITLAGVLPLSTRKLARLAADTTPDDIEHAIERLTTDRFIVVDDITEECLVRSFIRHDGSFRVPNIHKAIIAAIARIESETLRAAATAELQRAVAENQETSRSQSMTEPLHEQSPEPLAEGYGHPSSKQQRSTEPSSSEAGHSDRRDESARNGITPAAAAAVEILVTHRLSTEPAVRAPARYAAKIRREEQAAHAAELNAVPIDADPITTAARIFGISPVHARIAARTIHSKRASA